MSTDWLFFHFHYFQLSFHYALFSSTCTFFGFSIPMLFFSPFVVLVFWMVHVHSIKFPFGIVFGSPIPILAISGNLVLWFLDFPGFNIVKSLNIPLVVVPSFSVGVGLCYVTFSSSLNCLKYRIFVFSNLDKRFVVAIILASFWSVLVNFFLLICYCV